MKYEDIKTPEELLNYMSLNMTYGFIGKSGKRYESLKDKKGLEEYIIQSGEEVLESNLGTCWDQVELERLWFSSHNYNFKTIFIGFDVDYENTYPTHTFLIYEDNNKFYWFENAWEEKRGIHEFNSFDDALDFVKELHFNYASERYGLSIDLKDKLESFSYDKPAPDLDVYSYVDHVTKNDFKIR